MSKSAKQSDDVKTMWALLDRVAEFERRVGALYDGFAEQLRDRPSVAAFWREVASDERLHALVVSAAREVFPAAAVALPGDWKGRLGQLDRLLSNVESNAKTRLPVEKMFAYAEALETSELNALTRLIIEQAGTGFSQLGPLVDCSGVDRHRDRVLGARRRFCAPTPD